MQFRVLGPLEVEGSAGPIGVNGPRLRALLGLLLVRANEVLSSDQLVDGLWGEETPSGGAHALEVYVSRLRKALGADRIETRPPGYRIRVDHGELDLHRFEGLVRDAARAGELGDLAGAATLYERAVAVWRGPALPDLDSGRFPRPEIVRLEEMRLMAVEAGIEARLSSGRPADVVSELEALVAVHPFREGLRAMLMRALYQLGRQADALRAFQTGRQNLVEELGIEPGPELQQLQVAILNQAPHLSPLRTAGRRQPGRSILVVGRAGERLDAGAGLAGILGRGSGTEAIIAGLASSEAELAEALTRATSAGASVRPDGVATRVIGFISGSPGVDAVRLAGREDVALVLSPGDGIGSDGTFDRYLTDLLGGSPADVGIVIDRGMPVRLSESSTIALPFGGTDDDWAALELAVRLASIGGPKLVVLGVPTKERDAAATTRLIADASLIVQRMTDVVAQPRVADQGADGLVRSLGDAELVIAGLSRNWRETGLGPVRTAIAQRTPGAVVFVRRGLRPGLLAPTEGMTAFTWSLAGEPTG